MRLIRNVGLQDANAGLVIAFLFGRLIFLYYKIKNAGYLLFCFKEVIDLIWKVYTRVFLRDCRSISVLSSVISVK